ncbi:lipoprotein [Actinomyces sp. oral taxon 180 str. F0310]|nr:lipoprotein [Actinomyces sp. oral taxon 180 str. F0310]
MAGAPTSAHSISCAVCSHTLPATYATIAPNATGASLRGIPRHDAPDTRERGSHLIANIHADRTTPLPAAARL